ncbi:MAG: YceI family protein [Bacteroidota bacterium]
MAKSILVILPIIFLLAHCTPLQKENQSTSKDQPISIDEITGDKYEVDPASSVVTWIGRRPVRQHNGTIDIVGGSFTGQDTDLLAGEIFINIASIDIKDLKKDSDDYTKLKNHLLSDDFFYTDSFPTAKFELIKIIPYDTTIEIPDHEEFESENTPASFREFMVKEPTHYVSGNLTIRGITRRIDFPAIIYFRNNKLFAEAKFNIDRTQWNVKYDDESSVTDKLKDQFIYNTVNVGFSLQAIKAEE